ncbi:MAG: hypothetical protein J0I18_01370, partial [Actinobacteria bacterium]|nr:hypothetical protein [Actinomycetota bacterium]
VAALPGRVGRARHEPDTLRHLHRPRGDRRICAEQLTPYPPGIPASLPGEVIVSEVVDYLRSGLAAGMVIPDAADPSLATVRVVRELPGEL